MIRGILALCLVVVLASCCKDGDVRPYPGNCNDYLSCSKGRYTKEYCPFYKRYFDTVSKKCAYWEAACGNPECVEETVELRPGCKEYVICRDGKRVTVTCPGTTLYDPKAGECRDGYNCTTTPTTTPYPQTKTTNIGPQVTTVTPQQSTANIPKDTTTVPKQSTANKPKTTTVVPPQSTANKPKTTTVAPPQSTANKPIITTVAPPQSTANKPKTTTVAPPQSTANTPKDTTAVPTQTTANTPEDTTPTPPQTTLGPITPTLPTCVQGSKRFVDCTHYLVCDKDSWKMEECTLGTKFDKVEMRCMFWGATC